MKKMRKATTAIFGGALTMQALPLLKKSGRTTSAMTGTATGMVGIGIAGLTAGMAFEMVKAPYEWALAKKRKRKRR